MKLSEEEKTTLRQKLDAKMDLGDGASSTPYDMVCQLIPYEIRHPEDSAAMQSVISSTTSEGRIDFDLRGHTKINPESYQQLYKTLRRLNEFADKGNLNNHSELTLEKELQKSRETLIDLLGELSKDQQTQVLYLRSKAMHDQTKKLLM